MMTDAGWRMVAGERLSNRPPAVAVMRMHLPCQSGMNERASQAVRRSYGCKIDATGSKVGPLSCQLPTASDLRIARVTFPLPIVLASNRVSPHTLPAVVRNNRHC